MKRTEIVLVIVFVISCLVKLAGIVGGGILTTFFGLLLCLYYFLFAFALFNDIPFKGIFKKEPYAGKKPGEIIIPILTGYGLSVAISTIIFQLNKWPGGRVMVFASGVHLIFLLGLSFLFYMLYQKRVYKRVAYKNATYILACVVATICSSLFIAPPVY